MEKLFVQINNGIKFFIILV